MLYQLLVKYYPSNIQYQIDLIDFVDNVLYNELEAQMLARTTISFIDDKRAYLSKYINK